MTEFVKQCLHCMDSKADEKIPRPLGETVHGTGTSEVLYFHYFYVGDNGLLGKDELDGGGKFKYTLVMMDDLSNFVRLEPMESSKHLLRWCRTLRVPEVWVSNTASHFKNRVMKTLEGALRVEPMFALANSPSCQTRVGRNFVGGEARYSRMGGRGTSVTVDSEHGL